MGCGERRKCKCCCKLFRPDPRNRRHQYYCSASGCRAASKTASQARWLAKPENQSYFRGSVNVARVQTWRAHHPGYWRKGRCVGSALQDVSTAQPSGSAVEPAAACSRNSCSRLACCSSQQNASIGIFKPPQYAPGRQTDVEPPRNAIEAEHAGARHDAEIELFVKIDRDAAPNDVTAE